MSTIPRAFCTGAGSGQLQQGMTRVFSLRKLYGILGKTCDHILPSREATHVMGENYSIRAVQIFQSLQGGPMPENVLSGDQLAWALVAEKERAVICKQADVKYDFIANKYIMQSFGQELFVDVANYRITSCSPLGELLLHGLGHFFDLAALWYLGTAKNIPASGRMIRPTSLSGGEIFHKGTHVLPLSSIADRYCNDFEGFYSKGMDLGGQQLDYGDACLRLFPFPRVPVTMILWREDEEFPARADMFFDSTCERHLPTDVIWSTAMTSVLIML
jgi:hypothetical protein